MIGVPIIKGKPLEFLVGDKITILGWSPNKKGTLMEPSAFPAHVLRVFVWYYLKDEKVRTDTMYDVKFDGDTEPDPVPPRVRQPHMYGADWANIVVKPGTKLPKAMKIPKELRTEPKKTAQRERKALVQESQA